MKFYESYGLINIDGYRRAKSRVRDGKLGVYTKIDGSGKVVIYLLHRNLDHIKWACSLIVAPKYFIHTEHRKDYGYYYIRLLEPFVSRWEKVMATNPVWRQI